MASKGLYSVATDQRDRCGCRKRDIAKDTECLRKQCVTGGAHEDDPERQPSCEGHWEQASSQSGRGQNEKLFGHEGPKDTDSHDQCSQHQDGGRHELIVSYVWVAA